MTVSCVDINFMLFLFPVSRLIDFPILLIKTTRCMILMLIVEGKAIFWQLFNGNGVMYDIMYAAPQDRDCCLV